MVFQSASKIRNVDRSKILREQTTLGQFFAGIADVFKPIEEDIDITEDHRAEVTARISNFCEEYPVYRVEPTDSELELLWRACSADDGEVVASAIYEQFTWASGEAEWQPRLRALRILQYFSRQGDKGMAIVEEVLTDAGETIRYLADHVPKCRSAAAQLVHLRRQLAECSNLGGGANDIVIDKPVLQNSNNVSKEEAPLLDINSDEEDGWILQVSDEIRHPGVPWESAMPEPVPSIRPQLRTNAPSPVAATRTRTSIVELLTEIRGAAVNGPSSTDEKENSGQVNLSVPTNYKEKSEKADRTCTLSRATSAPALHEPPGSLKEISIAQNEINSIEFCLADADLVDRTTAAAPSLDGMYARSQSTSSLPKVMSAQHGVAEAAERHVDRSNCVTLSAKGLPATCIQRSSVKPYLWLSVADKVEFPQAEDKFAFLARKL